MLYRIIKAADSDGNEFDLSRSDIRCATLQQITDTSVSEDGSVKVFFYDDKTGHHVVCNPGWIKFDLGKAVPVAYIRLHLWDSCGNGKQQPSHRKYQYRLLYTAEDPFLPDAVWNTVYDTMSNGSNGWQEFYQEGGFGNARGFMIHLMNNSRNQYTQVVRFQVGECPTLNLAEAFNITVPSGMESPAVHRIINNRIICGSSQEAAISNEIFSEVRKKLRSLEDEMRQRGVSEEDTRKLETLCKETEERIDELNTIDTEIRNLTVSLVKPVHDEFETQRTFEKRWARINKVTAVLTALTLMIDIISEFF